MISNNGFLQLLGDRQFLYLWSAQLISQLADKVLLILLIAIATSEAYVSYSVPVNSRESMIMIASTVPAILFGSIAGIYVDLYPKRMVMIVCNILRGLLVLIIPFLPKMLILLLTVTFIISIFTQLFAPAEQSAIPLLVPESCLMSANALFTLTMMGAMIIGFAIGSPLLHLFAGIRFGQELLVGGMYLMAGLVLFFLPKNEVIPKRDHLHNVWQDLKDGLKYLRHNPLISGAILQLVIFYGVFAAMLKLSINLSEIITNNRTDFGFLLAAAGVGLAIGALILGHFGDRFAHRPLPLVGFIGMALMLIFFALVKDLWLALILAVILGFNGSLVGVPMLTVIQKYTPENMRGKVFGLLNNAENIAVSLPLAIAAVTLDASISALGEVKGLQLVMFICSAIVLGLGLWSWSITRKALAKDIN
ncbi:arabinose efflux permease family protein [Synechococcus sp. PCC 7502]|uniref:MFS transporter n=1 Tax=Synechococcus sp. PCC 7502 TaxID=1173263 RepID=UPI00029FA1AE|nr:MFS transporter [Synechococcus sp. PCC 7502]AFY74000.1 arabinose efflux permease family protein [Synechococcus sp. PCC 7502]